MHDIVMKVLTHEIGADIKGVVGLENLYRVPNRLGKCHWIPGDEVVSRPSLGGSRDVMLSRDGTWIIYQLLDIG
jgi:hypothetical protein